MMLLTFVNCSSFEMRTKRQLNLSCAPFIVVVAAAVAVAVFVVGFLIYFCLALMMRHLCCHIQCNFVGSALLIKCCEIRAVCASKIAINTYLKWRYDECIHMYICAIIVNSE